MIFDTLGRKVLVSSRGWLGGLRRIGRTCDKGVGPLMGGLRVSSRVQRKAKPQEGREEKEKEKERKEEGQLAEAGEKTYPLDSKQT